MASAYAACSGKSTHRIIRDSSSSGTVPKGAVCSNTTPCWINREVVPAAGQVFPWGSYAHHGC
jgi:hypothetical protein